MKNFYFTGVGSRNISEEEWETIKAVSAWIVSQGGILRSGKAEGSDSAFEQGVEESVEPSSKEIYIPWEGAGMNQIPTHDKVFVLDKPSSVNYALSIEHVLSVMDQQHWDNLKQGGKKLHQRNTHQVLGQDLENPAPSLFLLACADNTRNGDVKGGTATAWKLAKKFNVPCLNIRGKSKREIFVFLKAILEGRENDRTN